MKSLNPKVWLMLFAMTQSTFVASTYAATSDSISVSSATRHASHLTQMKVTVAEGTVPRTNKASEKPTIVADSGQDYDDNSQRDYDYTGSSRFKAIG